jgi:hypothetical protein
MLGQKAGSRLGALAIGVAGSGVASAGFVALGRAGFALCHHHLSAAQTMRMEGMPGMSGMATAVAGTGDVCPIVVNVALAFAGIVLALLAWLVLSATAPLVAAISAALRTLLRPGAGAPWLGRLRPVVVAAPGEAARRRPSRAPPHR